MRFFPQKLLSELANGRFTYVDAGSLGGLDEDWKPYSPLLDVFAFDPDARAASDLVGDGVRFLPYVLADRRRPLTFHVSREAGKSSIYRPNSALLDRFPHSERFELLRRVSVAVEHVRTLDEALQEAGRVGGDFLKLDTQGSELAILQGSTDVLSRCWGIKVEVEFEEIYQGQALFPAVDAFVRGRGFMLYDLRRVYWKRTSGASLRGRGQLVFGDALYYLRPERVIRRLAGRKERGTPDSLVRPLVAASVYGAWDYCAELLALGRDAWPSHEGWFARMDRRLRSAARSARLTPRAFPRALVQLYDAVDRRFNPRNRAWADGDARLGNS